MLMSQNLQRTIQNAVSGDGIIDTPSLTSSAPTALELDTELFNKVGQWIIYRAPTFSGVTASSYVPTLVGAASAFRVADDSVAATGASSVFLVTIGSNRSY